MAEATTEPAGEGETIVGYIQSHSDEIAENVSRYGYLVGDSLVLIALGMLVVFVLHRLAIRFLLPRVKRPRLLFVIFGTLYILVLVFTAILVFKKVGFEVATAGSVAMLVVLFLAVVVYFLLPFFPRLPFKPGHTIETHGVMGSVHTITSFHTMIRKFDGTMVFLPNAMVVATKILNYSYDPNRRVELAVSLDPDCDLHQAREQLLAVMADCDTVLAEPAPVMHLAGADSAGLHATLYCWTENANFLGTRTRLWSGIVRLAREPNGIRLAVPKQQIRLEQDD